MDPINGEQDQDGIPPTHVMLCHCVACGKGLAVESLLPAPVMVCPNTEIKVCPLCLTSDSSAMLCGDCPVAEASEDHKEDHMGLNCLPGVEVTFVPIGDTDVSTEACHPPGPCPDWCPSHCMATLLQSEDESIGSQDTGSN